MKSRLQPRLRQVKPAETPASNGLFSGPDPLSWFRTPHKYEQQYRTHQPRENEQSHKPNPYNHLHCQYPAHAPYNYEMSDSNGKGAQGLAQPSMYPF